jgi:hypothetical protein
MSDVPKKSPKQLDADIAAALKTDKKPSIEEAFAIGRPARTTAYKTCRRCKGTGWWELGRKCFGCGGRGHVEKVTLATKLRDARAHLAERVEMVATNRALLAEKHAAGRPRWTWMNLERDIDRELETIAKIEAEIAELESQA